LVIIDDTAYFQPYTFGRGKTADQKNLTLGPLMPVFKFQKQDEASTETFSILEDHFKKLWSTTDTDLLHVGARIRNQDAILKQIFRNRKDWFSHVYEVLSKAAEDRRKYPRKPCESKPPPSIGVLWQEDGKPQRAEAEIKNFSREGILLKLKSGRPPGEEIKIVTLKVQQVKPDEATGYIISEFITPCKGMFTIKRPESAQQSTMVALQANINGA